ncbi:SusC/RagA family TonB-linked outer membrane protein [Maribacter cobaltidurans]|nr:SusC/RagA family TonB-linked outer membrane protein [Maribacter cobaltidurans]
MVICLGVQLTSANATTTNIKFVLDETLQSTVTGTVTDESGTPLPGANVIEKGTTNGTQTDFDGNFTLNVESGATLVFSYIGFQSQEVAVNGRSTIDVTLAEDAAALDEVVVTGYQVLTKRETTAAVSIVKAEELAAIPSGNVEQQLAGRVAGVNVITNGQPGTQSVVRVRGFGAFGGNQPLYVVDGVPVLDIGFLNPDDIQTTTVLKDAAAASIYGSRAANGVIVYTTKSGNRQGRTQINIDIQSGVTDPNVNGSPKMLNPQQMAEYTHLAYENNARANGTAPQYTHPQYGTNPTPSFPDYLHASYTDANGDPVSLNGIRGSVDLAQIRASYEANPGGTFLIRPNLQGTNWYKEITRIAPQTRASLNMRGGNEKGSYYLGLGLQSLQGILLENDQQRYTARFNSDWDLTPWLKIGENLQVTYNSVRGQTGATGGLGIADDESEILSAYRMPTVIPVFDEFGSYASTRAGGFNNPRNPVRRLKQDRGNDVAFDMSLFGNVFAEIQPLKGLTFRTSLGGQYSQFNSLNYDYIYLGDSEPQASFAFQENSRYGFQWTFTNTVSYEKLFGKHKINLFGGYEAINGAASPVTRAQGREVQVRATSGNPISTDLDFVTPQAIGNEVPQSFIFSGVNFSSVFGKLDYNFDERYYLTGVIRRDGSSVFGASNRFGVFPAVSAAWRTIDEAFMQNQTFFSDLKFRVGWGEMGNSNNVSPTNQFSLFGAAIDNTFYPIGGQNSGADQGFAATTIGNPDAKWETSVTTNVGFDAAFFGNKVQLVFDWWKKDTKDLLFPRPLPAVTGNYATAPLVNIGEMSNRGVDFQIIWRDNITEDLSFDITLNNSFLKNEIVSFDEELGLDFVDGGLNGNFGGNFRGLQPTRNFVGKPLSSFFGYQVVGYFNSQAEVDANTYTNDEGDVLPAQDGQGLGRFKYADINGDGRITPDDRTYLGDPIPEYSGGAVLNLKYKNLSFETFWNWTTGVELFNAGKWFRDFFGTFEGSAKGVAAFNSWTPELGNNAAAPIWESATNISTSGASNSWYVESGDYLRLQRLAVNYDFREIADNLGIAKLNVGFSANNIWTITKYSGLDPGVAGEADTRLGVDVGNYPVTPSYLFNVNIGL